MKLRHVGRLWRDGHQPAARVRLLGPGTLYYERDSGERDVQRQLAVNRYARCDGLLWDRVIYALDNVYYRVGKSIGVGYREGKDYANSPRGQGDENESRE